MDDKKNSEYIFWLDIWADRSEFWPKKGQFKCTISPKAICVVPVGMDANETLNIEMSSVQKCEIGYRSGNWNWLLKLSLDNKRVDLFPVNPFDPAHVLYLNHNEASSMLEVIRTLQSNIVSEIDPNPYVRQLTTKDKFKRFRTINIDWDKHTSPWDYYERYGDKFVWPKTIAQITALVVVAVLLVLGIAFLLDTLSII